MGDFVESIKRNLGDKKKLESSLPQLKTKFKELSDYFDKDYDLNGSSEFMRNLLEKIDYLFDQ